MLPVGCFDSLEKKLSTLKPDIYMTGNFEEVRAMVREKEIDRLCIVLGGYNCSEAHSNNIRGIKAARILHKINPDLPILVWNGTDIDNEGPDKNTVSLDAGNYETNAFLETTGNFLVSPSPSPAT